jgi:hypothetical protein
MLSHKGTEFKTDAVTVTWCSCERCLALGPRTMTLTRMGRECIVSLHAECCSTPPRDRVDEEDD